MLSGLKTKLVSFMGQCRRIITIATKPTKMEYAALAKVVAAGVAVLGVVGFLLYLVFNLVLFR